MKNKSCSNNKIDRDFEKAYKSRMASYFDKDPLENSNENRACTTGFEFLENNKNQQKTFDLLRKSNICLYSFRKSIF